MAGGGEKVKKKYYTAIAGGALVAGALVIALLMAVGLKSMTDIFVVLFCGMTTYLIVAEALMRLLDKPSRRNSFKVYTYDKAGNCTARYYR